MEKLSIAQASVKLGISQGVIRSRLRSGELEGQQEPCPGGFKWVITLPEETSQAAPPDGGTNGNDLVEMLKGQVQDLKDQLAVQNQQVDRLTQLLAAKSLGPGMDRPWWAIWRR